VLGQDAFASVRAVETGFAIRVGLFRMIVVMIEIMYHELDACCGFDIEIPVEIFDFEGLSIESIASA
jgi:hypothetical protein